MWALIGGAWQTLTVLNTEPGNCRLLGIPWTLLFIVMATDTELHPTSEARFEETGWNGTGTGGEGDMRLHNGMDCGLRGTVLPVLGMESGLGVELGKE